MRGSCSELLLERGFGLYPLGDVTPGGDDFELVEPGSPDIEERPPSAPGWWTASRTSSRPVKHPSVLREQERCLDDQRFETSMPTRGVPGRPLVKVTTKSTISPESGAG